MRPRMLTPVRKSWAANMLLAIGVSLAVTALTQERLFQLGVIQRLEQATLDFRFRHRGVTLPAKDSSHVVIVEISEDAFHSLPQNFPWPRSYYARLLRNLRQAGASAVGIDIIFSGSDAYDRANDDSLRAAILRTGLAVLAGKREEDNPDYVSLPGRQDFGNQFADVDSAIGLVNIRADADGIYRFYNVGYAVPQDSGGPRLVPTFAFAVLNRFLGLPPSTVPEPSGDAFRYAGRSIPEYDRASMLVNFYGASGTFPRVKFSDVIDDSTFTTVEERETGEQLNTFDDPDFGYLQSGMFKNKIVLVGVTVPEYKDLFPVSIAQGRQRGDNLMYGVEIHANVIENVLRNDFLRMEPWTLDVTSIVVFASLTMFVSLALKGIKTKRHSLVEAGGVLFVALEMFAIGAIAVGLFDGAHYVVMITGPLLAVAGGYVASTTYHYVAERKQRLMIKSIFSTYVNPSVVEELIAHPEKLVLGGEKRELTVLFSDVEGFTDISQGMEPEDLVALLNDYLKVVSDVVFRNTGTLDKYIGDGVMAFWGAPIPQDDHALRACLTALEMQEELFSMNAEWRERSRPSFNTRIGVHTGEMVVGNMGSVDKKGYTVIGDSVNLGSRLEGANKEYRTRIMVSERTYELVKHAILGRELDRITVKGRTRPVTTYELLQIREGTVDGRITDFLELYNRGLSHYYGRRWENARNSFERALRLLPGDYPTQLHLKRVRTYQVDPPPEQWDGVFIMKTK